MGAKNRTVVAGSGLVESLYQSPKVRRHHQQVASRLATFCVAIRVRCALWRQYSTMRSDLAYFVADLEPEHSFERVPCLIVGVMDVQRRDPFVLRFARVSPLDDHEIALRSTELLARERSEEASARHHVDDPSRRSQIVGKSLTARSRSVLFAGLET